MSQTESVSTSPLIGVVKGVAVVACSRQALLAGCCMPIISVPGLSFITPWVTGAILCGLAAGCLTMLLGFRRWGALLSPVFASVAVLFSWFVRGIRTYSYHHALDSHSDKLVRVGKSHRDYSGVIPMLVVACIVSVVAFLLCRAIANRKR